MFKKSSHQFVIRHHCRHSDRGTHLRSWVVKSTMRDDANRMQTWTWPPVRRVEDLGLKKVGNFPLWRSSTPQVSRVARCVGTHFLPRCCRNHLFKGFRVLNIFVYDYKSALISSETFFIFLIF